MKKVYFTLLLFGLLITSAAQNIDISVTGYANFDNADYSISEAGEDFSASVLTESSAYISVDYLSLMDKIFGSDIKWRVFVNKSDISWNQNLSLEIKRSGNGTKASWLGPSPTINHGTSYQTVTNIPVYFFRGRYGITDIPLGFRLSGASLRMGANQFETTITFTVYDDW